MNSPSEKKPRSKNRRSITLPVFIAASFVVHALLLAFLASLPPLPRGPNMSALERNRIARTMFPKVTETETSMVPEKKDAVSQPHMARSAATNSAQDAGILSYLSSAHQTTQVQDSSIGRDPENALGQLAGDQSDGTLNGRPFAIRGSGRGGGATGEGTIGLGLINTIGAGGGGGTGSGYGRGAGGLGGKRAYGIRGTGPMLHTYSQESYKSISQNTFEMVQDKPISTFSIDVDTAAYANIRRFINGHMLPPSDAVRVEEMINYFSYDYALPKDDRPFSVNVETAACPWNPEHLVTRVGIQGKRISSRDRRRANLVFLIDVSGSMTPPNKLPLLKQSLKQMAMQLRGDDRVAIVVYADATGMVLNSTPCNRKDSIVNAIDNLEAGGSTNGGDGISLAYHIAQQNFVKDGINRVILATDGDFNVGLTSMSQLEKLIRAKRKSGVFLSVLGVGMGNYKDDTLEMLAQKGNGNYAYIDSAREARRVLIEQANGTLVTIAKDVKIQVEFNPKRVGAYRLIGYENRILQAKDFKNDKKDAGEIGAGHTVTALYELVPPENMQTLESDVDALRYQKTQKVASDQFADELYTLKLRHRPVHENTSIESVYRVTDAHFQKKPSKNFQLATAVAGFGMLLRRDAHAPGLSYDTVLNQALGAAQSDPTGYRSEFVDLVKKARQLSRRDVSAR